MDDPIWADILVFFTQPYWITPPEAARAAADTWVDAMLDRFDLRNYNDVKNNIGDIILRATSGTMPPPPASGPHTQRFPPEAIRVLQVWKNIKCPEFDE